MKCAIKTKNKKGHSSISQTLLLAAVFVITVVQIGFALPSGEQVAAGQASFDRQGSSLSVTNTPNTIINWQNFSIGSSEAVRFIQQNQQSAVLNRIVGQNPSVILGLLQSNGKVLLINPNGIVFGAGARVDVQGLIASTLNLTNADFLSGRYLFNAGVKSADIVNSGTITTPSGGSVYLIATNVTNNGIITTPQGQVMLAAGHSVKLVDSANPAIAVVVSAPEHQAVNLGSIMAQSGSVGIYGALVRQAGQINAGSAVKDSQGRIVLKASQKLELGMESVTSAVNSSGRGGVVTITGDEIHLKSGAKVDASGETGGGEIYVGGGYQGLDASIANARRTSVERGVQLSADALTEGDGGKVVVWSDEHTAFAGRISARGAIIAGDGGVAEVSGKKTLTYDGVADLSAPNGLNGTLLLDPLNLTIGADITGAALGSQLALSNVIVQTSDSGSEAGNIYVNENVSWNTGNTLTMKAHNDIVVNAVMANSGGGALKLRSDSDGNGSGTVLFGAGGQVSFTAGGQASIYYNPAGGYTSPTSYAAYFSGVTPTAYMLVNNVNQLQSINTNLGGTYALGKDIDASATSGWNSGAGFLPIGYYDPANPLAGPSDPLYITFDGNGYTISNLYINRPTMQYVGLFRGSTEGNPTFRNIWLFNVNIRGGFQTGGAVAHLGIGHALSYSFVTGSVTGGSNVGGLVGLSAGPITNCYSKASVTGGTWVGGLVGTNWGTQARITNSYSTGLVTGSSSVGGLVGYAYNTVASPVTASYWNTQTSGRSSSVGGTGQTTAEMMSEATFSGWDFTNIWGINEGSTYPYFTGNHLIPAGTTVVVDPVTPAPTPVPSTPNPIVARQMAADNTAIAQNTAVNNFYLSWNENVPHYESWDDYFKTHVRGISWNENVAHYDSWNDYVKAHPWFITGIAMNRSPQLDMEGRFIDGLVNSLAYLTTVGDGGIGFAGLQKGGAYGGYTASQFKLESTITRTKQDQELADRINAGKKVPINFVHDNNKTSGEESVLTLTSEQWDFIKRVNGLRDDAKSESKENWQVYTGQLEGMTKSMDAIWSESTIDHTDPKTGLTVYRTADGKLFTSLDAADYRLKTEKKQTGENWQVYTGQLEGMTKSMDAIWSESTIDHTDPKTGLTVYRTADGKLFTSLDAADYRLKTEKKQTGENWQVYTGQLEGMTKSMDAIWSESTIDHTDPKTGLTVYRTADGKLFTSLDAADYRLKTEKKQTGENWQVYTGQLEGMTKSMDAIWSESTIDHTDPKTGLTVYRTADGKLFTSLDAADYRLKTEKKQTGENWQVYTGQLEGMTKSMDAIWSESTIDHTDPKTGLTVYRTADGKLFTSLDAVDYRIKTEGSLTSTTGKKLTSDSKSTGAGYGTPDNPTPEQLAAYNKYYEDQKKYGAGYGTADNPTPEQRAAYDKYYENQKKYGAGYGTADNPTPEQRAAYDKYYEDQKKYGAGYGTPDNPTPEQLAAYNKYYEDQKKYGAGYGTADNPTPEQRAAYDKYYEDQKKYGTGYGTADNPTPEQRALFEKYYSTQNKNGEGYSASQTQTGTASSSGGQNKIILETIKEIFGNEAGFVFIPFL